VPVCPRNPLQGHLPHDKNIEAVHNQHDEGFIPCDLPISHHLQQTINNNGYSDKNSSLDITFVFYFIASNVTKQLCKQYNHYIG